MTITDQIFRKVAETSIPHFYNSGVFSIRHRNAGTYRGFPAEKYEVILRGASGRKFIYKEGEWRLIFTFFPTDRVVDERYALKNKVQMKSKR